MSFSIIFHKLNHGMILLHVWSTMILQWYLSLKSMVLPCVCIYSLANLMSCSSVVSLAVTAGMVWSVRRWSLPAITLSPPSANRRGIACFSRTCCCSAAPGPISPSHASVPAETTWKDRWRCARTAYNTDRTAQCRQCQCCNVRWCD